MTVVNVLDWLIIFNYYVGVNQYSLYTGFAHLAAGLCTGLSGLASGICIGEAGAAGVRCKLQNTRAIIFYFFGFVFMNYL